MSKRTAAGIAAAVAGAAAVYYVLMTASPGEQGYLYRLMSPVVCAVLLVAEDLFERTGALRISDGTAALMRLFAALCIIGGRAFAFYSRVPFYDKMLHTLSGILFTLTGAETARRSRGSSAFSAAMTGVMLSLSVGYVWELFEFAGDALFGLDSQRWSVGLLGYVPDLGAWLVSDPRGHAIIDTMEDMFVCLAGSVAGAVCAYVSARRSAI